MDLGQSRLTSPRRSEASSIDAGLASSSARSNIWPSKSSACGKNVLARSRMASVWWPRTASDGWMPTRGNVPWRPHSRTEFEYAQFRRLQQRYEAPFSSTNTHRTPWGGFGPCTGHLALRGGRASDGQAPGRRLDQQLLECPSFEGRRTTRSIVIGASAEPIGP